MPGKYPLHTGIFQTIGEGSVTVDGVTLRGIQADAWRWADGRHTVEQLAEIHSVSLKILEIVYSELNYFCFVYFSSF